MALKLKTAPSVTPISLTEAKMHCRVDATDDDELITALINAAVSYLDGYSGILGRCLMPQVWQLCYDAFPSGPLQIPLGPVISIDSVEYVDPVSGNYVAWNAANYETDLVSLEAWIAPVDSWPTPMTTLNAVRITFTAGYADAASVPPAIRHAMLLLIGTWYENRAASSETPMTEIPFAATALLAPFRRVGI